MYYGRRRGGHKMNGIRKPEDRHDVARRIAGVISQQRRGRSAPDLGMRSGRIDKRRLARAKSDPRIFTQRTAPSPERLRVVVILDLSGSMMGYRVNAAVQTAWDFVLAAQSLPQVTMEVWGHGTAYVEPGEELAEGAESVREGNYVVGYELYREGMDARNFHRQFKNIRLCGNEDGFALQQIGQDVMRRASKDERVLIVMVSDGYPIYREMKGGFRHTRDVVKGLRRKGAAVVSVSIAQDLRGSQQAEMYGRDIVTYDENPQVLSTNIGRVIGRALN